MNKMTEKLVVNAPIEKVWSALTNKNEMKKWYFDMPDFELKEGAVFNFYEPGDTKQFLHRCKITQIEPLKTFQHTWTYPDYSKGESVVTWSLQPKAGKTEVTLAHEGVETLLDGGDAFKEENYRAGWHEIVQNMLKKFVEE